MPKYFPRLENKTDLIARMIAAIKSAKTNSSASAALNTKLAFGQSNLGEYLGYLNESRDGFGGKTPGEFNNLEKLTAEEGADPSSNDLVYANKQWFIVSKSSFLSPQDIKEILDQSGVTAEQLKDEDVFKSFLSQLIESYVTNPIEKTRRIPGGGGFETVNLSPEEAIDEIIFRQREFIKKPDYEGGGMERRRHEYKKCTTPVTVVAAKPTPTPAPQVAPLVKMPAQTAFQDAIHDIFKSPSKPDASARAKLRDSFAHAVLPAEELAYLNNNNRQLDTTEFLNYMLDALLDEGEKIELESTISNNSARSATKSSETKLELPFTATSATEEISCKAMFDKFREVEDFTPENRPTLGAGKAEKKQLSPKVKDPTTDLVISLKRTDYSTGVAEKLHNPVKLDELEVDVVGGGKQKYEATAFIVHIGPTPNSGHYVTYIKESDDKWYCYNDDSRTLVEGKELEDAKKQAYTVKYSPLADGVTDAIQGPARYKKGLPASQGEGTSNGGVRCWANAAFAFALSMTSLHDNTHVRTAEPEEKRQKTEGEINLLTPGQKSVESYVNWILEVVYGKEPDPLTLARKLQALNKDGNTRQGVDNRLAGMELEPAANLFHREVERCLLKLAERDPEKSKEVLGLYGLLSDETGLENTIKILEAIQANQSGFLNSPVNFVTPLIAGDEDTKKEKINKPADAPILSAVDICHDAIERGDAEVLKSHIKRAQEMDKNFLTNALCHATFADRGEIVRSLIDDYQANPEKQSPLYEGKTAKEIVAESGKNFFEPKPQKQQPIPTPPQKQPTPPTPKPTSQKQPNPPPTPKPTLPKSADLKIFDEPFQVGGNLRKIEADKVTVKAKVKTEVKNNEGAVIGAKVEVKDVEIKKNPLLDITPADVSTGKEASVAVDKEKFSKAAMDYYRSWKGGEDKERRDKGKGEELAGALNIYLAAPNPSVKATSASKVASAKSVARGGHF